MIMIIGPRQKNCGCSNHLEINEHVLVWGKLLAELMGQEQLLIEFFGTEVLVLVFWSDYEMENSEHIELSKSVYYVRSFCEGD